MCFLNHTAPVRRMLGGLFALVLIFTNLGRVHATSSPPEEEQVERYKNHGNGIVNATFGLNDVCLLDAWTAVGTVTTAPTGWGDCKAVLSADNSTADRAAAVTTALEQTFVVHGGKLRLYTNLTSNNVNGGFVSQRITLYDARGRVIDQLALNQQLSYIYEYDLSQHVGETVRLSMAVNLDPTKSGSPSKASMAVDFHMLYTGPEPEGPPGGGI
jgi:hypothetical protein